MPDPQLELYQILVSNSYACLIHTHTHTHAKRERERCLKEFAAYKCYKHCFGSNDTHLYHSSRHVTKVHEARFIIQLIGETHSLLLPNPTALSHHQKLLKPPKPLLNQKLQIQLDMCDQRGSAYLQK